MSQLNKIKYKNSEEEETKAKKGRELVKGDQTEDVVSIFDYFDIIELHQIVRSIFPSQ